MTTYVLTLDVTSFRSTSKRDIETGEGLDIGARLMADIASRQGDREADVKVVGMSDSVAQVKVSFEADSTPLAVSLATSAVKDIRGVSFDRVRLMRGRTEIARLDV